MAANSTMKFGGGKQALSLDELKTLLLDASIQIDRILLGQDNDPTLISTALESVRTLYGFSSGGATPADVTDPRIITLYSRALITTGEPGVKSVQDLTEQLQKVLRESSAADKNQKSSLEILRDFFLSLHKELISQAFAVSQRTGKKNVRFSTVSEML